jgi:hypothetical protein
VAPACHACPLSLSLCLVLAACPGGEAKKTDAKKVEAKDTKAEDDTKLDPSTSLSKAVQAIDTTGPVPPEVSGVVFAVDGALIPIACFIKGKKLDSGKACLAAVKKGDDVYLKSKGTEVLDKIGDPKGANCEVGASGAPTSLATAQVDSGAAFEIAVSPKSLARLVTLMPEESLTDRRPSLSAEETAAITALSKVQGELTISQTVVQDIDGDAAPDKIVAAYQFNPKDGERYTFAGVFVLRAGKWTIADSASDIKGLTVRATIDLDGDKIHELLINANGTDGSGGDRLVQLTADGGNPIGKWSCGV